MSVRADPLPPRRSQPFRGLHLRGKLLLAFLFVAALPMLLSAWMAAKTMEQVFDYSLRGWLEEGSSFFLAGLEESRAEAASLTEFVAGNQSLLASLRKGEPIVSDRSLQLLQVLGYDLLLIYDSKGDLVFRSHPFDTIDLLPASGKVQLYRIKSGDSSKVMLAASQPVHTGERDYTFVVGSWLDRDYVQSIRAFGSFEVRLYLRGSKDQRLVAIYSSSDSELGHELPEEAQRRFEAGENSVYLRDGPLPKPRVSYRALRDEQGVLVGTVMCALSQRETLTQMVNQTNLFVGIAAIGIALSFAMAMVLSRRIVRPLRRLAAAAHQVGDGAFPTVEIERTGDETQALSIAFADMVARLRMMSELEIRLRRADRMAALGEVAVGIAHEVRNPLGIIRGSAEYLQKNPEAVATESRLLGYVVDEVVRIDRLISEFLAFARPSDPAFQPLAVHEVIDRVLRGTGHELERLGIEAVVDDRTEGASINADPNQMQQALLNIVLNAISAMEGGGTLTIRSLRAAGPGGADEVRIEFLDTGPGVPEHLVDRVFDPFFTTKASGTGLGLARVQSIVEAHGGRVALRANQPRGAVFTLALPLA